MFRGGLRYRTKSDKKGGTADMFRPLQQCKGLFLLKMGKKSEEDKKAGEFVKEAL